MLASRKAALQSNKKMIPKNPADAIMAVMGDGNQCELLTLGNSRRVSLKLGRA